MGGAYCMPAEVSKRANHTRSQTSFYNTMWGKMQDMNCSKMKIVSEEAHEWGRLSE